MKPTHFRPHIERKPPTHPFPLSVEDIDNRPSRPNRPSNSRQNLGDREVRHQFLVPDHDRSENPLILIYMVAITSVRLNLEQNQLVWISHRARSKNSIRPSG